MIKIENNNASKFQDSMDDIKKLSEKQYKELLKSINKDNINIEGFVLGEQKEIYDKSVSLDDILNGKG